MHRIIQRSTNRSSGSNVGLAGVVACFSAATLAAGNVALDSTFFDRGHASEYYPDRLDQPPGPVSSLDERSDRLDRRFLVHTVPEVTDLPSRSGSLDYRSALIVNYLGISEQHRRVEIVLN